MTVSSASCRPATSARTKSSSIPGNEQNQSVTVGELVVFPDLLLFTEGGSKLLGTVEVETGESVNAIEARAEWGVYSKLRVPLHLYVPPACVDAVKRICAEYQILVSELWTYTTSFDQVRFNMVHRAPDAPVVRVSASKPEPAPKAAPAKRRGRQTGRRQAEARRQGQARGESRNLRPRPSPPQKSRRRKPKAQAANRRRRKPRKKGRK